MKLIKIIEDIIHDFKRKDWIVVLLSATTLYMLLMYFVAQMTQ